MSGVPLVVMAAALPLAAQLGTVNRVIIPSQPVTAETPVALSITGTNPCGAVQLDTGDGQVVTHPIERLPATISHRYARPGAYRIRAVGMGNCTGEATTNLSVAQPSQPSSEQGGQMRFRGMDRDGDGVITRNEWRGSDQSFRIHDWNGDSVLSGDEVRVGGRRGGRSDDDDFQPAARGQFSNWTEAGFSDLDHNRDGRITSNEWHYDVEAFHRVDRNRDGVLSRSEFLGTDVDEDREDRFDYLDVNRNGRIERAEWHGSADAFDWLDRNNDGVLTRREVVGDGRGDANLFRSLDVDRSGTISPNEWHWSRRSFEQRDLNRDGVLTRRELTDTEPLAAPTAGRVVLVNPTQRWTDTGLAVRAGDVITFDAEGTVQLSTDPNDVAGPEGARSGRRAAAAPLRQQLAGGLIVKVGDSSPGFVGVRRTIRAPADGRVYLGVNDDHLGDNTGEFRVTVAVSGR